MRAAMGIDPAVITIGAGNLASRHVLNAAGARLLKEVGYTPVLPCPLAARRA